MHWVSKKRKRKLLQEAFLGGWQAALGTNVTSPRVRRVVESCFELWLEDAAGEVDVLGLRFRRRWDLPGTTLPQQALEPFRPDATVVARIPVQRTPPDGPVTSPGAHRRPASLWPSAPPLPQRADQP